MVRCLDKDAAQGRVISRQHQRLAVGVAHRGLVGVGGDVEADIFKASGGFEIDGDSASVGELCALISSLADVPIRQSLAITGSINQFGEVQAVGGVNEKIEGFFDICRARGFDGEHGVIIPADNVKHLMLRRDVVDAVAEKRFHVWAIETVDEGMEILTALPMGERDEQGNYPENSVNHRVEQRLAELAEHRKTFSHIERGESE